MSGSQGGDEVEGGKHEGARAQADAATRAQAAGDDAQAAGMMDTALRTDPDGLANALAQDADGAVFTEDAGTASDDEVASISRTIAPHAAAPSRAGITGPGSGADSMDD